jgi:hypothetical protein
MQQGGFGSDDAQEEQRGLIGRASDLAAGLKHPRTAFFHLIFKASAIFSYMFGTWISDSFVNVFIVCVLLLAFDFWTVKNVSGRLMVGLRWWSEVLDDGSTQWRFESQEDAVDSTMLDVGVFWGGLFLPAVRPPPGLARAAAAAAAPRAPLTRAAAAPAAAGHLVPLRPRLALPAELRLAAAHLRRAVPERREHHRLRPM